MLHYTYMAYLGYPKLRTFWGKYHRTKHLIVQCGSFRNGFLSKHKYEWGELPQFSRAVAISFLISEANIYYIHYGL